MLSQLSGTSERDDPRHEECEPPERAMPMDAYLQRDRLVVYVDLLDVDPETVSVALDGNILTVTAAHTGGNGSDARYARELSLDRSVEQDHVRARVHDGAVTVMLDLRDGDDRPGSSARR